MIISRDVIVLGNNGIEPISLGFVHAVKMLIIVENTFVKLKIAEFCYLAGNLHPRISADNQNMFSLF